MVSMAINMRATLEKRLEMVFSIKSDTMLQSEHELDNLVSREYEVIWSNGLGARQLPAINDMSRRRFCSDPLPGND
jgi:hypothetical protein